MQIKTTKRYHYTLIRTVKKLTEAEKTDIAKYQRRRATTVLVDCWVECKTVQPSQEGLAVSYKVKHALTMLRHMCTRKIVHKYEQQLYSESPKLETTQMSTGWIHSGIQQ